MPNNPITNQDLLNLAKDIKSDLSSGNIKLSPKFQSPLIEAAPTAYGFGESKFDTSDISISHLQEEGALGDIRGQKQGALDKWANGITKAAGIAGTSILENTAGLLYGIGDAVIEQDLSKIYDNHFTRELDSFNNYLREQMPNYSTKAAEDYNILQKLGTANFWSDQFLSGVAYSGAALATGYGLNKFASLAKLARAGVVIDEAKLAAEGSAYLDKISRGIKIADAADFAKNAALMSHAESAIEARETKDSTKEQLIKDFTTKYGYEPDEKALKTIEDISNAAGNWGYVSNLAITGTTNALQFPKLLAKGYVANKTALNNIELQGEKFVAEQLNPTTELLKKMSQGVVTEGGQELSQLFSNKVLTDYYGRGFKDKKDQHDLVESIMVGFEQTLGTQEGWENFLLGALIGGPMQMRGAKSDAQDKNVRSQEVASLLNNPEIQKTIKNFDNFVRSSSYEKDKNDALIEGSKFDYLTAEFNQDKAIAKQFIDNNATDLLIKQYQDLSGMPEEEFKKLAGYEENKPLPKSQIEIINNAVNLVKEMDKAVTDIKTLFPYSEEKYSNPTNYDILTTNLWHYSTSINNVNKRVKDINNELFKIAADNNISIIDTKSGFAIEDNPLAAQQVNLLNQDLIKANILKKALVESYNKLANPETQKAALEEIVKDAEVKTEESKQKVEDSKPVEQKVKEQVQTKKTEEGTISPNLYEEKIKLAKTEGELDLINDDLVEQDKHSPELTDLIAQKRVELQLNKPTEGSLEENLQTTIDENTIEQPPIPTLTPKVISKLKDNEDKTLDTYQSSGVSDNKGKFRTNQKTTVTNFAYLSYQYSTANEDEFTETLTTKFDDKGIPIRDKSDLILSTPEIAQGTELEFKIDTNYPNFEELSKSQNTTPIAIYLKGGESPIAYVHTPEWVKKNVANDYIDQVLFETNEIRKQVFESDKPIEGVIKGKTIGRLNKIENQGEKNNLGYVNSPIEVLGKQSETNPNEFESGRIIVAKSQNTAIIGKNSQSKNLLVNDLIPGAVYLEIPTSLKDNYFATFVKVGTLKDINQTEVILKAIEQHLTKTGQKVNGYDLNTPKGLFDFIGELTFVGKGQKRDAQTLDFNITDEALFLNIGATKDIGFNFKSSVEKNLEKFNSVKADLTNVLDNKYFNVKADKLDSKKEFKIFKVEGNILVEDKTYKNYTEYLAKEILKSNIHPEFYGDIRTFFHQSNISFGLKIKEDTQEVQTFTQTEEDVAKKLGLALEEDVDEDSLFGDTNDSTNEKPNFKNPNQLFGLGSTPQQLEFHINTLNVVSKFLENLGVEQRLVPNFLAQDGTVVEGAIAAANFIDGTVDIIEEMDSRMEAWNKLPEEAAHWWYRLLDSNSPLKDALLESAKTSHKEKELRASLYGDIYEGGPIPQGEIDLTTGKYKLSPIREEAIGQLIAEAIKRVEEKNASPKDYSFLKKFIDWINQLIDKFKSIKQDPFEVAAIKILTSDMKDIMSYSEYKALNDTIYFPEVLTNEAVEQKENLDTVLDSDQIFKNFLKGKYRKRTKFLNKTLERLYTIQDSKSNLDLPQWLGHTNDTLKLDSFVRKLNEYEKEIITRTNNFQNLIPTLKGLNTILTKFKNNPISLNSPLKIDGVKKEEILIYQNIINLIKNENPNLKSISAEQFVSEVHNYLKVNYALGFAEEKNYLGYRVDQTFAYRTSREQLNQFELNPTDEEIQNMTHQERQDLAERLGINKTNPEIAHRKISLRFNESYFNRSTHFNYSPSAWGNLTPFYTNKETANKGIKDAVLIHEIQNDNIEFLKEKKDKELLDIDKSVASYFNQLDQDYKKNIDLIENNNIKIVTNSNLINKHLLKSSFDNLLAAYYFNQGVRELDNNQISVLKEYLEEQRNLAHSFGISKEAAKQNLDNAYEARQIWENFRRQGGIKDVLSEDELSEIQEIIYTLNQNSEDDNPFNLEVSFKEKRRNFETRMYPFEEKIKKHLEKVYGTNNIPSFKFKINQKPLPNRQRGQTNLLNPSIKYLLYLTEDSSLKKLNDRIINSKVSYIDAIKRNNSLKFANAMLKLNGEQINTIYKNLVYNIELLNSAVENKAKQELAKKKSGEVDETLILNQDLEYQKLKEITLAKKEELGVKWEKNQQELSDRIKLEMNYFTPLVHQLIQTHIKDYGKHIPLYFSGYQITKLTQGNEATAKIYAGPEEVKWGYTDKVGALWTAMNSISGVKLKYVQKVPGFLDESTGGYLVDLNDYKYESPILYGLSINKSPDFSNTNLKYYRIEDLTLEQQNQIIDSLVATINVLIEENYKPKEAFEKAFRRLKKMYNLAVMAGNIDKARIVKLAFTNWNSSKSFTGFKNLVEIKLAQLGTKIEDNNLQEEDGLMEKRNFSEGATFKVNPKDKASARIKRLLSTIQKDKYSVIGLPLFYDYNELYNSLLTYLADTPFNKMVSELQELGTTKPEFRKVYDRLVSLDKSIMNEFLTVMKNRYSEFLTPIADINANGVSLYFRKSNINSAESLIINNWLEEFKSSDILEQVTEGENIGNLKINEAKSKELLDRFNKALKNTTKGVGEFYSNKQLEDFSNLFKEIGVNISTKALEDLRINSPRFYGMPINSLLSLKLSNIFKTLAGSNKNQNETDILFDKNNPFINEEESLKILARAQKKYEENLINSSFKNATGNSVFAYNNPTYLTDQLLELNNPEYIKQLEATPFASTSYYLEELAKEDSDFKKVFHISYLDAFRKAKSNEEAIEYSGMSKKLRELTKLALFQNQGKQTTNITGLTYSDKDQTTIVSVPRIDIGTGVNAWKDVDSEAFNHLRALAIGELKRISLTQQQINTLPKEQLIEGYHKGAKGGLIAFLFTKLNNSEILFPNGELVEDWADSNKEIYKLEIDTIIKQEVESWISDKMNTWVKEGLYNSYEDNLFDKSYLKGGKLGIRTKVSSNDDVLEYAASDYVINYAIANGNLIQILHGDLALAGKKGSKTEGYIRNTYVNYFKRLAKDIAPGVESPNTESKTSVLYLKDVDFRNEYVNKFFKDDKSKKINGTDAQGIITTQHYLTKLFERGLIKEPIFNSMISKIKEFPNNYDSKFTNEERAVIFQPRKPVYVKGNIENGINKIVYLKLSDYPLLPSLTKNTKLDNLRKLMESENGVDLAIFESGAKLGMQKATNLYDDKGNWVLTKEDIINNRVYLDSTGFKIQQDNPLKESNKILEATQQRKLLFVDIPENVEFTFEGKTVNKKDLKKKFDDLHIELLEQKFNNLLEEFNIKTDDKGQYSIESMTKFHEFIMKEAIDREWNPNELASIQLDKDNRNFVLNLMYLPNAEKLESLFTSILTNNVVKNKLPGHSYIQGSSIGYESAEKNVFSDPEYKYMQKDEFGYYSEVAIAWPYKNLKYSDYVNEDGTPKTEMFDREMLYLIGYRIPNQGHNSMSRLKIKRFLRPEVGDLMLVPSEITLQMGSDFDVDKMYSYTYNHKMVDGKITKYKFDEQEIRDLYSKKNDEAVDKLLIAIFGEEYKEAFLESDEQNIQNLIKKAKQKVIENSIVEVNDSVLSNEYLKDKIEQPLGFDALQEAVDKIGKLNKQRTSEYSILYDETSDVSYVANKSGKLLTGTTSLSATNHALAQEAHLYIKRNPKNDTEVSVLFKDDNDKVYEDKEKYAGAPSKGAWRLDKTLGFSGTPISFVISGLQSAAVDNAKEQLMGKANINKHTYGVGALIARTGFDEEFIVAFLNQDVIHTMVDELEKLNDPTQDFSKKIKKKDLLTELQVKYEKLAGIEAIDEIRAFSKQEMFNMLSYETQKQQGNIASEKLDALEKFYNLGQAQILYNFIKYDEVASELTTIQNSLTPETQGVGKSMSEMLYKQAQIEKVQLGGKYIANVDNLFNKTYIGQVIDKAIFKGNSVFKNLYPYSDKSYNFIEESIVEQIGDDRQLSSEELDKIYKEVKSSLFTKDGLFTSDIENERLRLLIDTFTLNKGVKTFSTKSLAQRLFEYKGNNPFFKKLSTELTIKSGEPSYVLYNASLVEEDTESFQNSINWQEALKSGNLEEKQLAEDLVLYAYLTGGVQTKSSFVKFVPAEYLIEKIGTKKIVDFSDPTAFVYITKQFFQHNPWRARQIKQDWSQVNLKEKGLPESFTVNRNNTKSAGLLIEYKNEVKLPEYLSYKTKDKWLLYENTGFNAMGENVYERVNTLGGFNLKEYNINQDNDKSVISSNNPVKVKSKPETKGADLNNNQIEQVQPIASNDTILTQMIEKNQLGDALQYIENLGGRYGVLAGVLKDKISGLHTSIDTSISSKGQQEGSQIKINPNNNDNLEQLSDTILHETLHGITVGKIEAFEQGDFTKLTQSEIDTLESLKTLMKLSKTKIKDFEGKQNKLQEYIKKYKGLDLSPNEIEEAKQLVNEVYGLTNLKEFVTMSMTNKVFQGVLNEIPFGKKTLLDRFLDLIKKLVGFEVKAGSVLEQAINDVLTLIENKSSNPLIQNELVGFTNYSGGALGSDTEWKNVAKQFGIETVDYIPSTLNRLNETQLKEVEDAYQQAAKDLGRNTLDKNSYSGQLVRRDYLQAKAGDSVFAIGTILNPGDTNSKGYKIKSKHQSVDGGTGYAVQMAINLEKPVYVFDQPKNSWFKADYKEDLFGKKTFDSFIEVDTPKLTPKFAGVGTRELKSNGKNAIREVFENTLTSNQLIDLNGNKVTKLTDYIKSVKSISREDIMDILISNKVANTKTGQLLMTIGDRTQEQKNAGYKGDKYYENKKKLQYVQREFPGLLDLTETPSTFKIAIRQDFIDKFNSGTQLTLNLSPSFKTKTTGDLGLDKYISKWDNQIKILKGQKTKNPEQAAEKQAAIDVLEKRKSELIEEKSIDLIFDTANVQLKQVEELLKQDEQTEESLQKALNYIAGWEDIGEIFDFEPNSDNAKVLGEIITSSVYLRKKWSEAAKQYLADRAKTIRPEWTYDKLFKEQIDTSFGSSMFFDSSVSSVAIEQFLDKLIKDTSFRVNSEVDEKSKEIDDKIKAIGGKKAFTKLLQTYENGKLTGNLVSPIKQEYYDKVNKLAEAARSDSKQWKQYWDFVKSNSYVLTIEEAKSGKSIHFTQKEIDKQLELLDVYEKQRIKFIEEEKERLSYSSSYQNKGTNEQEQLDYERNLAENIESWERENSPYLREQYEQEVNEGKRKAKDLRGMKGYRYLIYPKPKEQWQDAKYKALTKEQLEFLEYFKDTIEEYLKFLPVESDIQSNYIPEIRKGLIERIISDKNTKILSGIGASFVEKITTDFISEREYGVIDEETGKPIRQLRTGMLAGKLSADEKSYDLGSVLKEFVFMASAIKYKSEVEFQVTLGEKLLNEIEEQAVSPDGIKRDWQNNPIKITNGLNNTKERVNYLIDTFYGIRKDIEGVSKEIKSGPLKGKRLAGSKIGDSINQLTTAKGLALNPFSGMVNLFFGKISNRIHASSNQEFGDGDLNKAEAIVATSIFNSKGTKEKLALLMDKLQVLGDINHANYGGKSSFDKLYIFQRMGEFMVQAEAMTAILIKNDLWSKVEVKDGQLVFPEGFTEKEIIALSDKIQQTIKYLHGNYQINSPTRIKKHIWGRMLMVFRNWIPYSLQNRFGREMVDYRLGRTKKGRYITYGTLGFTGSMKTLLKLSVLGKATGQKLEGVSEVDEANMRQNLRELSYMATMYLMTMVLSGLAKGTDDDDEKAVYTYFLNMASRTESDIWFYVSPKAFNQIIKDPIPSLKTFNDFVKLVNSTGHWVIGDDEIKYGKHKGESGLVRSFKQNFPVLTQLVNLETLSEKAFE